jgi:hypothetical protein
MSKLGRMVTMQPRRKTATTIRPDGISIMQPRKEATAIAAVVRPDGIALKRPTAEQLAVAQYMQTKDLCGNSRHHQASPHDRTIMQLHLSIIEKYLLKKAAAQEGISPSLWLRHLIQKALQLENREGFKPDRPDTPEV